MDDEKQLPRIHSGPGARIIMATQPKVKSATLPEMEHPNQSFWKYGGLEYLCRPGPGRTAAGKATIARNPATGHPIDYKNPHTPLGSVAIEGSCGGSLFTRVERGESNQYDTTMFDPNRFDEICREDSHLQKLLTRHAEHGMEKTRTSIVQRIRELFETKLLVEICEHYDSIEVTLIDAIMTRASRQSNVC